MEAGLMPHQAASDATSKHADFKVLARCGSVSQYIVAMIAMAAMVSQCVAMF